MKTRGRKQLRIGIDCRTILNPTQGERAGIGQYTYQLVKHLLKIDKRNTYVLFYDHRAGSLKEFTQKRVELVRLPLSQYKKYLPLAYSHVVVANTFSQANLDVLHAPANVLPLHYKKPAVVTIHDLAIYSHPEWFPSGQDFSVKWLVPSSVRKAKHVIAVSQATAQDITRQFHLPKQRVSVIHEGIAQTKSISKLTARRHLKPYHLSERYFVYIGTLEPRKNIAGIINAFDSIACSKFKRYKDIQLILAGQKGYHFEDTYNTIQGAKCGRIRYIGYVSDAVKQALLSQALGLVFPSFYEGFGLPVLEAMQAGTPVITSKISSLPELVGKSALLINPAKQFELEHAIDKLASSKITRERLIKKGKVQAEQFSWEKCARETLVVYEKVAENKTS